MVVTDELIAEFAPWAEKIDGGAITNKVLCKCCVKRLPATTSDCLKHSQTQIHVAIVNALARADAKRKQEQAEAEPAIPARRKSARILAKQAETEPKPLIQCRVCLYDNSELAQEKHHIKFLPCGHILCSRCVPLVIAEGVLGGECPTCRRKVQRKDCHRLQLD